MIKTRRLTGALGAAAMALTLGAAPLSAGAQELVLVDVAPVSKELAAHLRVGPNTLPPNVDMSDKLAAVVCQVSLKQIRDSKAAASRPNCVAVGMSQGLIQAVRLKMKNP